jgi:hypothetical protein
LNRTPVEDSYWTELQLELVIGQSTVEISYWTDLQKIGGGISRLRAQCELPWLWNGDSFRNQEGEIPPLEADTRRQVRESRKRKLMRV